MGEVLSGPFGFHFGTLPEDDDVVISREKLAEILRKYKQLEEDLQRKNEEIRRLRDRNRKIESELRALRASPLVLAGSDRTAEAGGIPSSRVFYHRVRREVIPRKQGGQIGHPGHARPAPLPNAPPVKLSMESCRLCGSSLGMPVSVRTRTITELPLPQPKIFHVEIPRYHCSGCHRKVEPEDPYPRFSPFGPMLMARALHLRLLGLSVQKISAFMEEAHGVALSPSVILRMERHTAELFDLTYQELKDQLRRVPVLGADETGFRIGGDNGWLWTFTHPNAVVYRIAGSRGTDVVEEMIGGYRGTIIRDGWKPYDSLLDANHQLDALHVNRWLEQGEIKHRLEPRPLLREVEAKLTSAGHPPEEFLRFADGVRRLLRNAILWSDAHPEAPGRVRRRVAKAAYRSMTRLLREPWRDSDARRISQTLWFHRRRLFTFLVLPGVSWNNNDSETQIRQGVLYRKISGGRRSWTGAWVLERLLTIYRTCQKRKLEFIEVLKGALTAKIAPTLATT